MSVVLSHWMHFLPILATMSLVIYLVPPAEAECTSAALNWLPISEEDYDRTYSEINMVTKRPLGYTVGTYNYNKGESVCVRVAGTSERHVEVKIETQPAAKICVKVAGADGGKCVDSKILGLCENFPDAGDNSTTFEFYCTGECSESDVTFWYRFRVCPLATYDENEQWCDNVEDDYPSTLQVVPPNLVPTSTTPVVDDASATMASLVLLCVALSAYICFI